MKNEKEGQKTWKRQKTGHEHRARTDEKDLKKCRGTVPVPMNHKIITT
jgi:hypothetical protein